MRVVVGWQGSDRNAARTNTMSRFETETLTQEDNLKGLALMNPQWVELAMAHTPHRRVILDMDSSESPVHGQQEGAAYNGHFECVCYHPLFLFNQFGDCEGATLRPGNVHSADGWQELLEPVVKGYQKKGLRSFLCSSYRIEDVLGRHIRLGPDDRQTSANARPHGAEVRWADRSPYRNKHIVRFGYL